MVSKVKGVEDILPLASSTCGITNVFAFASLPDSKADNTKVTGTGTNFTANAAVGDLLVVTDGTYPLRSFAKVIKTIDSATVMNVESNFLYVGQGRVTTNAGNNLVVISANSNTIGDFLKTGDTIRFNVGNTAANIETYQITVGSGTTLTLNNNANTSNTELVYHVVPDYTAAVAHTIIKVSV